MNKRVFLQILLISLALSGTSFSQDIFLGETTFSDGTAARVHLTDERNKYCPPGGTWFVARVLTRDGKKGAADPLCWSFGEGDSFILSDALSGSSQSVLAGVAPTQDGSTNFRKFEELWVAIGRRQTKMEIEDMKASGMIGDSGGNQDEGSPPHDCSREAGILRDVAKKRDRGVPMVNSLLFVYSSDLPGNMGSIETLIRDLYKYKEGSPESVYKNAFKLCNLKNKLRKNQKESSISTHR